MNLLFEAVNIQHKIHQILLLEVHVHSTSSLKQMRPYMYKALLGRDSDLREGVLL